MGLWKVLITELARISPGWINVEELQWAKCQNQNPKWWHLKVGSGKDDDLPVKDGLVILPPVTRMSQGIWATCPVVSDFQTSKLWEASVDKLPSLVLFLLLAVYSDEGSNLLHVYWALGKIWGGGYSPACMQPWVQIPIPEKKWQERLLWWLTCSHLLTISQWTSSLLHDAVWVAGDLLVSTIIIYISAVDPWPDILCFEYLSKMWVFFSFLQWCLWGNRHS